MRANGLGLSFMIVTSKGNIISAYQGNFLQYALTIRLKRLIDYF